MNCYLCDDELLFVPSWRGLFYNDFDEVICRKCKSGFERIHGQVCRICGIAGERLCQECKNWETTEFKGLIQSGQSLYSYNDVMKEYFHQYKFLQDIVLARVFSAEISQMLKKSKAAIVPIPMNDEKLEERTFSQVDCMLEAANLSFSHFLKKSSEVQGEKNKAERMLTRDLFVWNGEQVPSDIVIVDDIYTTGTTMRQAAQVLKQAGAQKISIFTLIRVGL